MLSVNFKDVGNTEGIEIDKIFPGGGVKTELQAGTGGSTADKIMVYVNDGNGGGDYVSYFLFKAAKSNVNDYWWVNNSLQKCGVKFKNGDSFWFFKRGDAVVNATVSGEVDLTATKTIDILPGYNMIGNYFPTGLVLNDEIYTPAFWQGSGAKYGTGGSAADKVMVYVNDGNKGGDYISYFLFKAAKTNVNDYKWVNNSLQPMNTSIAEPGQGVWYYHRGTGMTLPLHMPTAK